MRYRRGPSRTSDWIGGDPRRLVKAAATEGRELGCRERKCRGDSEWMLGVMRLGLCEE